MRRLQFIVLALALVLAGCASSPDSEVTERLVAVDEALVAEDYEGARAEVAQLIDAAANLDSTSRREVVSAAEALLEELPETNEPEQSEAPEQPTPEPEPSEESDEDETESEEVPDEPGKSDKKDEKKDNGKKDEKAKKEGKGKKGD